MARCHRAYRPEPKPRPNAAARRGLAELRDALASDVPGPTGDAALAERERLAVEADAQRRRQGVLVLRGGH